ncbi:MAG TPA: metallophosphoesterase family protein [Thermoanaerobaculia bacterium]|jgi:putative phosphoesterase|nr:metallophosphoesterase family protein [Thermoanaerobaculia bacterium]
MEQQPVPAEGMRVGVVSDTHNLLRPGVLERLAGCERILHAGDVGDLEILDELGRIAPVLAVRGNTDFGAAAELPESVAGDLDGLPFRMVHRREDADPAWMPGLRLLIFGHSHRPKVEWQGDCLLLNPGACGPRRFLLPLTLAILTVAGQRIVPEILTVD